MNFFKSTLSTILIALLLTTCTNRNIDNKLPRSTPEAEGVSSEAILKFVETADTAVKEIHSFMLLRHGKVIAEAWWNPYQPDLKHTMYSLSKSFTSTAVGFAVTEKLLKLDDKVISFFPNDLPDTISPFLEKLTVRHLLTMSVGQDPDPTGKVRGNPDNWVKMFLSTPIVNEPGTKFLYNSLATYMCSAIVQKVTGQKVIDYLTPRFFVPLGIEGIDWEVNNQGINTGGWGLRLKTEDIARAGQFYLQKGMWNGKQILPEEWIEEATSAKIDQAPDMPKVKKDSSDWVQGYCYQFWRCRNNAFRGDGAAGQYMIVLPEQDAVIAITSETGDMQAELNLVWQYLLPAMTKGQLPANDEALSKLKLKLSSLTLPFYKKSANSPLQNEISGKQYLFSTNNEQLQSLTLEVSDTLAKLSVRKAEKDYVLYFKPDGWKISETDLPGPNLVPNKNISLLQPFKVAGSYTWLEDNSIELTLRYIESPHTETITCIFLDNKVGVSMKNIFSRADDIRLIEGIQAQK
jgi:CubicO group peptidase (beta-lactamase class C family)